MLKFLGENYYLDINELEKQVSYEKSMLPVVTANTESMDQQISVTRFETYAPQMQRVFEKISGYASYSQCSKSDGTHREWFLPNQCDGDLSL